MRKTGKTTEQRQESRIEKERQGVEIIKAERSKTRSMATLDTRLRVLEDLLLSGRGLK